MHRVNSPVVPPDLAVGLLPAPQALFDRLPVGLYMCDAPEGRIRWFNRRATELWGRAPEIGQSDERFCGAFRLYRLDGSPLPHAATPMADVLGDGAPVRDREVVLERPDGSRITVLVNIEPVHDADGRLVGAINAFQDISARKQAEDAVRAKERELADFIENAPIGLHCVDEDGRVLWANRAELDMLGYPPEEYAGRDIREFHADPERIEDILSRLRAGEVLDGYEARLRRRDGSIRHVLISSNVLWKNGRFLHTRCFTRDVTALRQAEEERGALLAAAEAAELRYRELVDSLDAIVWEADAATFRFSFVSRRAEAILGYPVRQWLEEPDFWANHLYPDDRHWAVEFCREQTRAGRDHTFEYRAMAGDGRIVWLRDVVRVGRDAAGTPTTLYGVMVDITEVKRGETEREQLLARTETALAQAEAASRLKDDFLAVLSHELRTPINAILGWARMLREGVVGAEGAERALDTIERNARSQAELIEGLLDLSGIVTGKLRLRQRAVELGAILDGALDAVRPAAEAKGVTIDPRAAAGGEGIVLKGDYERLQQVFWNLFSNSVKFTPPGGRVTLHVTRRNGLVEVRVSDTGQGISAAFLPHVFDRFRQADSSSRRSHGGLGLGLAIARELVEAHGGSLAADSAGEGQGATFTVRLPLPAGLDVREAAPETGSSDCATGAAPVSLEGLHAVAVDDDEDALDLLVLTLTRVGARVTAVRSAARALQTIAREPVDVVVADIGMPGEDGYSLVRRLRTEHDSRIPAIAVTAYASLTDRQRAVAAGFDSHIAKPYDPLDLVRAVARLVERSARQP